MPPLSILVVDDVEEFALLLAETLRSLGHNVTCAGDGKAGAALIRNHKFDVVITDIVMPAGDGFELIDETKRTQPNARIIAMSGGGKLYSAGACLQAAEQNGVHAALQKPFSTQAIALTLEKLFP